MPSPSRHMGLLEAGRWNSHVGRAETGFDGIRSARVRGGLELWDAEC